MATSAPAARGRCAARRGPETGGPRRVRGSPVGLVEPRHGQLQHEVVGQQNVGRVLCDPLAFILRFLPGVSGERDWLAAVAVTEPQVLFQFLALAVAERVHRIDDDGGDALAGVAGTLLPQYVVVDRDEVGERFSGAGACGQGVAFDPSRDFCGVRLVSVEQEALAECVVTALEPEHLRALRIERAVGDQVINVSAGPEAWIELDERRRPEMARGVGRIDFAGDVLGADPGEISGKNRSYSATSSSRKANTSISDSSTPQRWRAPRSRCTAPSAHRTVRHLRAACRRPASVRSHR